MKEPVGLKHDPQPCYWNSPPYLNSRQFPIITDSKTRYPFFTLLKGLGTTLIAGVGQDSAVI